MKKYKMPLKAKLLIASWVMSSVVGALTILAVQGIAARPAKRSAEVKQERVYEHVELPLRKQEKLYSLIAEKKARHAQTRVEEAERMYTELEEVVVEPIEMIFLATAYSSAPEENGGFGAVDCLYGRPLPEDAIATQLDILPYGTRVYIEGVGERVVVDTASQKTIDKMSKRAQEKGAEGWLDIYVGDNVDSAHEWGVRLVKVTVLEWGEGK